MISPSRNRSMRNTPCVDGCWGPKCSNISSASGSYFSSTRCGSTRVGRAVIASSPRGRMGVRGELAAQRMTGVVLGHHDPPQVGVAREGHADEVVLLAL